MCMYVCACSSATSGRGGRSPPPLSYKVLFSSLIWQKGEIEEEIGGDRVERGDRLIASLELHLLSILFYSMLCYGAVGYCSSCP